jgi:xanthine dehydrogenase/oxidase
MGVFRRSVIVDDSISGQNLTPETTILSSDIVYDMGWSMNPAIDIGQVEGAFVQGVGYLMTEKLVFQDDGPEIGRLNTTNTWR